MESGYQIPKAFSDCLTLRELGFPQLRRFQSMYYITPDKLICIDDLSCLKHDGDTDFEDVFNTLVFKPRIDDIIVNSPWLQEFICMDDGSWMVYSRVEEDKEYLAQTGRTDPFIRARGATAWEALLALWIAVKEKERKSDFTPQDAASSENQEIGTEPNS